MWRVFLLAAVLASALLMISCSQGRTYVCDVYFYSGGWLYQYSEDYYGSSPSNAESNCEDSYGASYDCRDCT